MPHLFGMPGQGMSPLSVGRAIAQVCVRREFTKLATGGTTPVVGTRFDTLTRELGDAFVRVELEGRGHSTLTAHRQQRAVDRVLQFFAARLR